MNRFAIAGLLTAGGLLGPVPADASPGTPPPVRQTHKLLASDGSESDQFGYGVAIDGRVALVGGFRAGVSGVDTGAAYLFDSFTGLPTGKLTAPATTNEDFFGISVGVDGGVAIVGAPYDSDNAFREGKAYLFDTVSGGTIAELGPDRRGWQDFGWSVAIGDGLAIVGSRRDSTNGTDSGAAYVFDAATGATVTKLVAPDGVSGDFFGTSVAIGGGVALVGTPQSDDAGTTSGAAYLFDAATGQSIAKLLPSDVETGDSFGASVAVGGGYALVGSIGDDDSGADAGAAYLFDAATGAELAKLLPADGAAADSFGVAVAIDDWGIAAVSANGDDDNGSGSGSAYLFDAATGVELAKPIADDGAIADFFGRSIAISRGRLLVGANADDDLGPASGSAYLFTIPEPAAAATSGLAALLLGGVSRRRPPC